MNNITIQEGDVLILKPTIRMNNLDRDYYRKIVIDQIEEGVIVIPEFFDFTIWKRSKAEEEQAFDQIQEESWND